ncbi:hypothetical protein LTR10_021161 [Elasticomyces elasticus]|nr:hypothetical protein LTR10_021161 [Elasticomyces elasticus]KAK5184067.1 hypothetical protein LTR44_003573 [Eurotiomycetes sp. CCFEE 6388]
MADSNTPSTTTNNSTRHNVQSAGDWKEHKKTCSGNAASRNTTASSGTAENTTSNGTQSAPKGLTATIEKPFTALQEKKWLYDRPEKDVYKLLIDACRLRLDDDYKFSGDADSIYGGASNGYGYFRGFLRKAENKTGLLPPWWTKEKAAECLRLGQQDGWSDLNCAIEKSDVMEHYGDGDMPMQLRLFVESILGSGPGGQSGATMLHFKAMAETGSIHTSTIDMSRIMGLQEAQPSSSTRSDAADPRTPSIPDITNFYTLFPKTLSDGPPPSGSFQIPLGPLKREYLQLQSQHHPDKYTSQPTAHQKALALSSLLNTAYKTLSDPLLRARYLLQHNYDVDITSEDNSTHRDLTDHETLMEVMEAQEAIEEAQTQEKIDALKEENRGRIEQTIQLLGEAFERGDVDAAKTECIRLNYWNSLQQGLHEWETGKEVRLIH